MYASKVRLSSGLKDRARAFSRPDNWRNWFYIACDYATIAGAIWLFYSFPGVPTYLVAVLLISSRMRAFDNLTHDASHRMLFKSRALNDWAGMLFCSFPIGTSPWAYTRSHMVHHNKLGDPQHDPDLIRMAEFGVDRFPVPRIEIVKHLLKVFLLIHTPRYLKGTLRTFIYTDNTPLSERIAFVCFWTTVLSLLTVFGLWQAFLLFWVIPYLTGFQILRYLAEISEHGGLYGSDQEIELVRNNFCNPLWRLVQYPHHDFYHLVHHLFPSVPHFNLPRVHRLLMKDRTYRRGHHCFGYFFAREPGFKSTMGEMVRKSIDEARSAAETPA